MNYKVVADLSDTEGVARNTPVFTLFEKDYFHGDTFTPPSNFKVNKVNFDGRGVKFDYSFPVIDESGKEVTNYRTVVLPLEPIGESTPEPVVNIPKKRAQKVQEE